MFEDFPLQWHWGFLLLTRLGCWVNIGWGVYIHRILSLVFFFLDIISISDPACAPCVFLLAICLLFPFFWLPGARMASCSTGRRGVNARSLSACGGGTVCGGGTACDGGGGNLVPVAVAAAVELMF